MLRKSFTLSSLPGFAAHAVPDQASQAQIAGSPAILLLGIVAWACLAGAAFGQALPNAGRFDPAQTGVTLPQGDKGAIEKPALSAGAGLPPGVDPNVKVKVMRIKFSGNNTVPDGELNKVVQGEIGKELDLAGLEAEIAKKVENYYRNKGFMGAQAYIPPQQSVDGTVEIEVMEGQYNGLVLRSTGKMNEERLRRTVEQNLCRSISAGCKGALVKEADYERTALLLRDLPGASTKVELSRENAPLGTTNFIVDSTPFFPSIWSVGLDNYGSLVTGVTRYNLGYINNNLSGEADQLQFNVVTTGNRSTNGAAGYTRPIGYEGARAGLAFSRGQYYLRGQGFDVIQAHGISSAWSAFINKPFLRTVNSSVYGSASLETRSGDDYIDLVTVQSHKRARVARTGLYGNVTDSFGGGGLTSYSTTYSLGNVTGSDPTDSVYLRTYGGFSKVQFNLTRQQALSGAWTLYGSFYGLRAMSRNLDGAEQIGIGGPSAVRAYSGEAGGNTGAVASLELRYTQPLMRWENKDLGTPMLTYAFFTDRGWVDYYRNVPVSELGKANSRSLGGQGISLTLQYPRYYVRGMYAVHPANQASVVEPGKTHKFWFEASYSF